MNKKCLICCFLSMVFILSLAACSSETSPALKQHDTAIETTNKENTAPNTGHSVPMNTVDFNTVAEIKGFFPEESGNQANNSKYSSSDNIYQYETHANAVHYTDAASSLHLPVANIPLDAYDFGAHYLPSNRTLDIIYIADSIQYCFIYFFDFDSDWYYGETPAFSNVQVGPYTIDFYQLDDLKGQHYFLGHIAINGIDLLVRIQGIEGTSVETFSFDIFNFIPFSSVGGNVTA